MIKRLLLLIFLTWFIPDNIQAFCIHYYFKEDKHKYSLKVETNYHRFQSRSFGRNLVHKNNTRYVYECSDNQSNNNGQTFAKPIYNKSHPTAIKRGENAIKRALENYNDTSLGFTMPMNGYAEVFLVEDNKLNVVVRDNKSNIIENYVFLYNQRKPIYVKRTKKNVQSQAPLNTYKRLVLYFDINKTILAADAAGGKSIDDVIVGSLAEFTFHPWDSNKKQSYYAYITEQLENKGIKGQDLKDRRKEELKKFPDFLKTNFPKLLQQFHQEKEQMKAALEKGKVLLINPKQLPIFDSFFEVVKWLDSHYKGKHTLHFRTFGSDLPDIIPLVEANSNLKISGQAKFQGDQLKMTLNNNETTLNSPEELYVLLSSPALANYGIQDDYKNWQANDFKKGGKRMPINFEDDNVLTVFFDDNAAEPGKPIVDPIDVYTGQHLNSNEMMKHGYIVAVNPKEAILDKNYFIKQLQSALEKQQMHRKQYSTHKVGQAINQNHQNLQKFRKRV